MRFARSVAPATCAAAVLLTAGARADEAPMGAPMGAPVDVPVEVRLGVLAHDLHALGGVENGADVSGEVLFASPVPQGVAPAAAQWLRDLLRPRLDLGFDANTLGYTSQLYAGATWSLATWRQVFRSDDAIFVEYGFGPALNNGNVGPGPPDRKALGANVLFHLTAELGYRLGPRWSLSAYFEHSSNAGLARYNESLNEAGVRVGLRF